MMCSRVLRPTIANNAYARFVNDFFERIRARYQRALGNSLKTRSVTVVFVIGVVAMLAAMFQFIQNELAPEEDQGVIFTFSQAPDHTSLDYLNKYTAPYIDIFREYEDEYQSSFMANGFLRRHAVKALGTAQHDFDANDSPNTAGAGPGAGAAKFRLQPAVAARGQRQYAG